MSRLDGGQAASGKSFTRPIVKSLMQPLKLRDQEMKRIEQAYQDLKKTSAKNKQLPEEPITDVRCLQTITKAKLVKRADMFIRKYGEPLTFWFYNEELATMTESNKRAFADLRTMDRLAYDLGAEYGSDTLSDASYNADVDVIYCSLFCATDNALREYMDKRSVEGGNCARNCFYKRASVSAARMACLLYYLFGMEASAKRKVARFYSFMATYILDGLLSRWGRQYEQMHKADEADEGSKTSLYDQLPHEFSRDQLREIIVKLDLSTPARIFISKWKRAKLIYESSETKDVYVKNY